MGDILTFRQQASPAVSRRAGDNPAGVEIIFFPGVRYERYIEPQESRVARKPRPRPAGGPANRGKKRPA